MNKGYSLWSVRGLLFIFDIENTRDINREEIIVSKDVNDDRELSELFDVLLKPEFFDYGEKERQPPLSGLMSRPLLHSLKHSGAFGDLYASLFR